MTRAELLQALKSHTWCLEFVLVALDELEAGTPLSAAHQHNYRGAIDALVSLLCAARGVDLTPTVSDDPVPPTTRTGETP